MEGDVNRNSVVMEIDVSELINSYPQDTTADNDVQHNQILVASSNTQERSQSALDMLKQIEMGTPESVQESFRTSGNEMSTQSLGTQQTGTSNQIVVNSNGEILYTLVQGNPGNNQLAFVQAQDSKPVSQFIPKTTSNTDNNILVPNPITQGLTTPVLHSTPKKKSSVAQTSLLKHKTQYNTQQSLLKSSPQNQTTVNSIQHNILAALINGQTLTTQPQIVLVPPQSNINQPQTSVPPTTPAPLQFVRKQNSPLKNEVGTTSASFMPMPTTINSSPASESPISNVNQSRSETSSSSLIMVSTDHNLVSNANCLTPQVTVGEHSNMESTISSQRQQGAHDVKEESINEGSVCTTKSNAETVLDPATGELQIVPEDSESNGAEKDMFDTFLKGIQDSLSLVDKMTSGDKEKALYTLQRLLSESSPKNQLITNSPESSPVKFAPETSEVMPEISVTNKLTTGPSTPAKEVSKVECVAEDNIAPLTSTRKMGSTSSAKEVIKRKYRGKSRETEKKEDIPQPLKKIKKDDAPRKQQKRVEQPPTVSQTRRTTRRKTKQISYATLQKEGLDAAKSRAVTIEDVVYETECEEEKVKNSVENVARETEEKEANETAASEQSDTERDQAQSPDDLLFTQSEIQDEEHDLKVSFELKEKYLHMERDKETKKWKRSCLNCGKQFKEKRGVHMHPCFMDHTNRPHQSRGYSPKKKKVEIHVKLAESGDNEDEKEAEEEETDTPFETLPAGTEYISMESQDLPPETLLNPQSIVIQMPDMGEKKTVLVSEQPKTRLADSDVVIKSTVNASNVIREADIIQNVTPLLNQSSDQLDITKDAIFNDSDVDNDNTDKSVTPDDSIDTNMVPETHVIVVANSINEKGKAKESNSYPCTDCDRVCESISSLQAHKRTHTGEQPFACDVCGRKFASTYNLYRHVAQAHGGKALACEHCEETFETVSLKKAHVKEVHPETLIPGPMTCDICGKLFKNIATLQYHRKNLHEQKNPHECHFCNRKFTFLSNLNRHMKLHTGERPHKCEHCEKGFIEKKSLKYHMATEHQDEKLIKQLHLDEKYECEICQMKFNQKSNLNAHRIVHTGEKPYGCQECGKRFSVKSNLKRHEQTHTGAKPFECPDCSKCFTEKRSMLVHQRIHTGERPHVCKICGKSFRQIGTLNSHMPVHDKQRKHLCTVCGSTFLRQSQLTYHAKKHLYEAHLKCGSCDMRFYRNGDLARHERTHTLERPYLCEICPKNFTRLQYLKEHMNFHNDVRPYKCKYCDLTFHDTASCHKHSKNHAKKVSRANKRKLLHEIRQWHNNQTISKIPGSTHEIVSQALSNISGNSQEITSQDLSKLKTSFETSSRDKRLNVVELMRGIQTYQPLVTIPGNSITIPENSIAISENSNSRALPGIINGQTFATVSDGTVQIVPANEINTPPDVTVKYEEVYADLEPVTVQLKVEGEEQTQEPVFTTLDLLQQANGENSEVRITQEQLQQLIGGGVNAELGSEIQIIQDGNCYSGVLVKQDTST